MYFTYFLNKVDHLFANENSDKKEVLLQALKRERTKGVHSFKHNGVSLAYVYGRTNGKYLIASLGKKSIIKKNAPPEEGFSTIKEETWPNCDLVFNLDDDPATGQRIAFEYSKAVFENPHTQIKAFADELNKDLFHSGWAISINPITSERKFWEFINSHKGKIERLTLTFNTPNLFKLNNALNDDLKELEQEYNVNKASLTLENVDGKLALPQDSDLINQSVEYITRGGGEYSVRIKGKGARVVSSNDNIKTKSVEFDDLEFFASSPDALKNALDSIFNL